MRDGTMKTCKIKLIGGPGNGRQVDCVEHDLHQYLQITLGRRHHYYRLAVKDGAHIYQYESSHA